MHIVDREVSYMAENEMENIQEQEIDENTVMENETGQEDTASDTPRRHRELPAGLKAVGYIAFVLIGILAFSYLATVLWFQIRIRPIRIDSDTVIESIRISGTADIEGESKAFEYILTDSDEYKDFIQITKTIRANRVVEDDRYETKAGGRCGVWITYQESAGNDQTEYFLVDGNVLKIEDSSDPMYYMTEDAYRSWWEYIEWLYHLHQMDE